MGKQPLASDLTNLIVHADDFGETEQITLGICEGIQAGMVTSTSIMANMPATDFALTRAKSIGDGASFGVHLNFCEGQPLTSASSLMDGNGNFCSKRQLFLRSITGRLKSGEVEREVQAQVQRILAGGVRVSHLDGHKHLHQLPVVCSAVAKVARSNNIERIRLSAMHSLSGYSSPSSAVREVLAVNAARVFRDSRLRYPRRLIDLRLCMGAVGRPASWRDRKSVV